MQAGVTTRMIHGMCPAFPLAVPVADRSKLDAATLAKAAAMGDDEDDDDGVAAGGGGAKKARKGAGGGSKASKKDGKTQEAEGAAAASSSSSDAGAGPRPPLVACVVGKMESSYGAVIDTGDTVRYPGETRGLRRDCTGRTGWPHAGADGTAGVWTFRDAVSPGGAAHEGSSRRRHLPPAALSTQATAARS
jgi:hypothetical protein